MMRVLIAADIHRPVRDEVSSDAVAGEIVAPVLIECTQPDRCRCSCAWVGLATAGFSGLAEVADRPNLTRSDVRRAVHGLLDEVGWIDDLVQAVEAGETTFDGVDVDDPVWAAERMIDDHIEQIERICETFPVGTVLSRLGDLVAPTVESLAA